MVLKDKVLCSLYYEPAFIQVFNIALNLESYEIMVISESYCSE